MNKRIRIATRKSPMALWQAQHIKNQLQLIHPHLKIELVGLVTQGDRSVTAPLVYLGGKSLFVKELQLALLNHNADIAVHCVKDMSVLPNPELSLAAVCKRDDPRDAFIANQYDAIEQLSESATIGTSSPRRTSLLKSLRPDLNIETLRGNVNTRLTKLDHGKYDGIILAAAGLKRLNMEDRIKQYFDPTTFIPAIGQGALGIECRQQDEAVIDLIKPLHHAATASCIAAERAVNKKLGGDCHTPIGAYANLSDGQLILRAMVGGMDGKTIIHAKKQGNVNEAYQIGFALADDLLAKGAASLLNLK